MSDLLCTAIFKTLAFYIPFHNHTHRHFSHKLKNTPKTNPGRSSDTLITFVKPTT